MDRLKMIFVIQEFLLFWIFWYSGFFGIQAFLLFRIFWYSRLFVFFQDYFDCRGGFNGLTDIDGKEEEKIINFRLCPGITKRKDLLCIWHIFLTHLISSYIGSSINFAKSGAYPQLRLMTKKNLLMLHGIQINPNSNLMKT